MVTSSMEQPSQVEQFGAVEVQRLYCRSPRCRPPDNPGEIFALRKVPRPPLQARVKERDRPPRL